MFTIFNNMEKEVKKKYYYYKKKVGRHKKPGPKKKKKIRGRRWQEPWLFKAVICNFKKQDKYVGQYRNLSDVEKVKKQLLEHNKRILFPKKFTTNTHKFKKTIESSSEFVILKRVEENESTTNQLRNEYGKFINVETTSEKWMVYERLPYYIEEKFWVYGYNPRMDRKELKWIIENFIDSYISDKYNVLQIFLYNNKVIFKYDNSTIEFVICKNVSDAIRMYNLLQTKYEKARNIIFCGMATKKTEKTAYIVSLLKEKTGWDMQKIYRKTTRA